LFSWPPAEKASEIKLHECMIEPLRFDPQSKHYDLIKNAVSAAPPEGTF
jgi:hypothetical protein